MYKEGTQIVLVSDILTNEKCKVYRIHLAFSVPKNYFIVPDYLTCDAITPYILSLTVDKVEDANEYVKEENEIIPYKTYLNIKSHLESSDISVRIEQVKFFDSTTEYAIIVNSDDFWLMSYPTYDEALNFVNKLNLKIEKKEVNTVC